MMKKRLFFCAFFLFLFTGFIYLALDQVKIQHLKKITYDIAKSEYFNTIIESANTRKKQSTIRIRVTLADQYDDLKLIDQFAVFEFLNRQIRYDLLTKDFENPFYNNDFEIIGQTSSNNYRYSNPVSHKQLAENAESIFQKNGYDVYNRRTFKNEFYKKYSPNIQEFTVLKYAEKMFSLISSGGKYHNHHSDSIVIYDAVEKRFGITKQEYDNIFRKYHLGMDYLPSIQIDASK